MGRYVDVRVALANARHRGPHYVVARAYIPDAIGALEYTPSPETATRLSIAGERIASVDALARSSAADVSQLAGLLARSEGIGSSTIEGYNASVEKIVVEAAMPQRPHTTTTAGVVRDGIEAITFALASLGSTASPMTPASIEEVQRRLLVNQGAHLRGYRYVFVQIGGDSSDPKSASFVPPPHQHVARLMDDLCTFINRDDSLHPIARAAIAHAQFETIHPFPDGNGRTGRALIQSMLRREGLMTSAVLPISASIAASDATRHAYIVALGGVRGLTSLDLTVQTFCDFIADAAHRTQSLISETENALLRLQTAVNARFRADSVAHGIVNLLVSSLGVSASGVAQAMGVSTQASRGALDAMEDEGLVASRAGGRSGRVYYAPSVLSVVAHASGAAASEPLPASLSGEALPGVLTGPGRGRPRTGRRCGAPLRTGGTCMRPDGHGNTGHRSRP